MQKKSSRKKSGTGRTLAMQIAARHARLSYNQVPAASRHAMKRLLLDYLGVAIAGSQTESGEIAREFATRQGRAPEATGSPAKSRLNRRAAT